MSQGEELSFSVDTHLLRQLGALLVGRDSTALIELIKNAYDADARTVTLHGDALDKPEGTIVVSDDGTGMTFEQFQESFLRIAGRTKENERLSAEFKRRYTGAKGIGRLAAHKLAKTLIVESIPLLPPAKRTGSITDKSRVGIRARLDWDRMEDEHRDLNSLGDSLVADRLPVQKTTRPGTTMTLRGVREPWDDKRLGPFLREVRGCRPPRVLTDPLPENVVKNRLLFDRPTVNQHDPKDPGFTLDLTGAFDGGDELWQNMASRADWVIEIDAKKSGVQYAISPTVRTRNSVLDRDGDPSWLTPRTIRGKHPRPSQGPFFQARILVIEGSVAQKRSRSELAQFARQESGVRVYMEGFRVLPYGLSGDDWLKLDRDYVTRTREFDVASVIDDSELPQRANEGFQILGNRGYFGAILLTEQGAPHLKMVVNREGFVPDAEYDSLTAMVRAGLDLSVRVRAALSDRFGEVKKAAEAAAKAAESAAAVAEAAKTAGFDPSDASIGPGEQDDRKWSDEPPGTDAAAGDEHFDASSQQTEEVPALGNGYLEDAEAGRIAVILTAAARAADDLGRDLPPNERTKQTDTLRAMLQVISLRVSDVRDEAVTLRTLAGVGTQYAAFIHEVNGLLGQAQALRDTVAELAEMSPYTKAQRETLTDVCTSADELVQSLTRQASYLTDVVGPDARRRRRRLDVRDRIESVLRLVGPQLNERRQDVVLDVPAGVATPPIFSAEISIVLTNLLTNAVKFAGNDGRIHIAADLDDRQQLHLTVENTGRAVDPRDYERFFRTFESSTDQIDVVLGQGMGLGLPIVRSLLAGYDGTADFVKPTPGYVTAVEVVLPDPRPRRRSRAA